MTLTNKPETFIFGGSFNPPTEAHRAIVEACFEMPDCGQVVLLPSGERRDKTIGLDRIHRLGLLEKLVQTVSIPERVFIDPFELDQPELTETYKAVRYVEKEYGANCRFVFGADSVATMATWHEGERMLQTLPMAVVPREGFAVPNAPNIIELPLQGVETVSSTEVRQKIAQGDDVGGLVCGAIAEYIATRDLYTS